MLRTPPRFFFFFPWENERRYDLTDWRRKRSATDLAKSHEHLVILQSWLCVCVDSLWVGVLFMEVSLWISLLLRIIWLVITAQAIYQFGIGHNCLMLWPETAAVTSAVFWLLQLTNQTCKHVFKALVSFQIRIFTESRYIWCVYRYINTLLNAIVVLGLRSFGVRLLLLTSEGAEGSERWTSELKKRPSIHSFHVAFRSIFQRKREIFFFPLLFVSFQPTAVLKKRWTWLASSGKSVHFLHVVYLLLSCWEKKWW